MGSRVENVGKKVEQASQLEQSGLEQGEKDAAEVSEIKSIIESMDTDVDEDIVEAMEATREAAKSEGADHMRTKVHTMLEQGYDVANEAISEGTDQGIKSRKAAADFTSITGVSEFGSSTAESSSSNAEHIAEHIFAI
ncbi:MAG: hypothetical protein IKJ01_09100, partial [Lachnospiraceae bacterium]|nr:hypothetical protein [Lachnospiraceae bacterium]